MVNHASRVTGRRYPWIGSGRVKENEKFTGRSGQVRQENSSYPQCSSGEMSDVAESDVGHGVSRGGQCNGASVPGTSWSS